MDGDGLMLIGPTVVLRVPGDAVVFSLVGADLETAAEIVDKSRDEGGLLPRMMRGRPSGRAVPALANDPLG